MIETLLEVLPYAVAAAVAATAYVLGHRDGVKVGKERADLKRYVKGYQHACGDIVRVLEDQARVTGRDGATRTAEHVARQRAAAQGRTQ